ncbi:MAG: hypothetical protein K9N34_00910 [Candidatus Marinimicrobia bacterium]|nr:hypothetical protein [Candidatus Neomarinimicrobiota bacterium]MCF7841137.1 hypothetical protein [Candidatus Neomarinimicrobiota bacterium]
MGQIQAGISSEEFPGFRRIVITGVLDTLPPPLVSCIMDSGGKKFSLVIAPLDTSRLQKRTRGIFRGEHPAKFSATFPDSQTLSLAVQTTGFSKVQPLYAYDENQIFINIYNPPVRKSPKPVEPSVTHVIPSTAPVPSKSRGISAYIAGLRGKSLFLKAMLLAALIIVLVTGLIMVAVRLTRRQDGDKNLSPKPVTVEDPQPSKDVNPEMPGAPSSEPRMPFNSSESVQGKDPDAEIRLAMKQQGITYDEARLMIWMQERDES